MSQYNEYRKCPHAFYLSRVERAWKRPAAWLPQGTAVHEAAEHRERDGLSTEDAQEVFRTAYAREVTRYAEETPNLDYWYSSGPYKGERDIERRHGIGLAQVAGYIAYTEQHPEEVIWISPDGTPGIELSIDLDLDGVPVRGFIDQVLTGDDGRPKVRDLKTGNEPGDAFQLAVYGLAISEKSEVDVLEGDYWMAGSSSKRKNPKVVPFDLREWTRERVTAEFHWLDENVRAERFDPKPEPSKCGFCSVRTACSFSVS